MATARRRMERTHIVDLTALIWQPLNNQLSGFHILEYIRCGALPGQSPTKVPHLPEVEIHMAKILAVGKFVMPDPPPSDQ